MRIFDFLLNDTKKEDAKISAEIATKKLSGGVASEKDKEKMQTKSPLAK